MTEPQPTEAPSQQPTKNSELASILARRPVVPVLVIEDAKAAVPLARALVRGGLDVLEITLRTDAAYDAVRAIKAEVDGAVVGVGTVLHKNQWEMAEREAAFAVSPGATDKLLDMARGSHLPLLPGAVTPGESMRLLENGYPFQKFFPAEVAGGAAYLKAMAAALPMIRFCPTGGIAAANARDYLTLANVVCVGGSWVAPREAVEAGDWKQVERLAREAASLAGHA